MAYLTAGKRRAIGSREHILYIRSRERMPFCGNTFARTYTAHTFARPYKQRSREHAELRTWRANRDFANLWKFLRSTKVEPISVGSPMYNFWFYFLEKEG